MLARLIVRMARQTLLLDHHLMHNLVADNVGVTTIGCALLCHGSGLLVRGRCGDGDIERHRRHNAQARPPSQAGV